MNFSELQDLRKQLRLKKRRIIINNDGNECVIRPTDQRGDDEPTLKNFLRKRSNGLIGSQVDSIFYCTGVFNIYYHQSKVSENHTNNNWAEELFKNEGKDTLSLMTDFCHTNNLECFWSMRMNDTHDSSPSKKHLFAQWKRDHLHCLMGKSRYKLFRNRFKYGKNRWSSVNYECLETRKQVFKIIEDVSTRYDIDGIELDFFRHPVLFYNQMIGKPVTQEQCNLMTELIRKIRKRTTELSIQKNKPIMIAIRSPNSVGYLKAIGIDIIQWLEEDLIDIITGGGYFILEPWNTFVTLAEKYQVPFYAALSGSRLINSGSPETQGDIEIWRNEGAAALNSGVNGIYLFNRFDPTDPIIHELGNLNTIKKFQTNYSPLYVNPTSWSKPGNWLKNGVKYVKDPETQI